MDANFWQFGAKLTTAVRDLWFVCWQPWTTFAPSRESRQIFRNCNTIVLFSCHLYLITAKSKVITFRLILQTNLITREKLQHISFNQILNGRWMFLLNDNAYKGPFLFAFPGATARSWTPLVVLATKAIFFVCIKFRSTPKAATGSSWGLFQIEKFFFGWENIRSENGRFQSVFGLVSSLYFVKSL